MSDVFISYARSTAKQAQTVADALRALGYGVWRDNELPAHRAYADVIEERLRAAKAVVVIWSAEALKSQWVRAEADFARQAGTLVQLSIDGASPPLPFNQIQCADLNGWSGDVAASGWTKVAGSVAELTGAGPVPPRPIEAPSPSSAARPSIAVMPFVNMSDEREQSFLADGMTEDVIIGLSLSRSLFVISRGTSFTYKNRPTNVRDVGRELGVRHVLEGSVRHRGATLRVTAQLSDVRDGAQVWAQTFDRPLADIFEVQDEITAGIVAALTSHLTNAVTADIVRARTDSLEAWELCKRAGGHFFVDVDLASLQESEDLLRQAVAKDPTYAIAWCRLGNVLTSRWMVAPDERAVDGDRDEARACIERAVGLAPTDADVLAGQGRFLMTTGNVREAVPFFQRAVELNPNEVTYRLNLARALERSGRKEEGLAETEAVLRLSPRDPMAPMLAYQMAEVQFSLGRYTEAEGWARRALAGGARGMRSRIVIAISLAGQGRVEAGQEFVREALKGAPLARLDQIEHVVRNWGWDEALTADILKFLAIAWPPELN